MLDQNGNGLGRASDAKLVRIKVPLSLAHHVFASSTGGLVARGITYPLDTLKTLFQVHPTQRTGAEAAVTRSVRQLQRPVMEYVQQRGARSLYQGVGVACALGTPALSLYYTAYDKSKETMCRLLGSDETTGIHVLSATMAEVISGVIWTPMELVKQKMQVHGTPLAKQAAQVQSPLMASSTKDISGLVRQIHQKHGVAGFYRGYFLGLMVFVPFSAVYFIAYEKLKAAMIAKHRRERGAGEGDGSDELSFVSYMSASAFSAVLGSVIANPMDVVKTRWQVNKQIPKGVTSPQQLAVHLYRHEGISSFAKGITARAMYTVPYVAISMAIYELIKQRLG